MLFQNYFMTIKSFMDLTINFIVFFRNIHVFIVFIVKNIEISEKHNKVDYQIVLTKWNIWRLRVLYNLSVMFHLFESFETLKSL